MREYQAFWPVYQAFWPELGRPVRLARTAGSVHPAAVLVRAVPVRVQSQEAEGRGFRLSPPLRS
jgi:hypothetical protein